MREADDADFGLLFCEARHAALYESLGWRQFAGDVLVTQPQGRVRFDVILPYVLDLGIAPRTGVIDLCGLPWRSIRARSGRSDGERSMHSIWLLSG